MHKFKLFAQLPKTDEELREHVAALSSLTNAKEHQAIFDHLYGCLSILDAKSSSLLAFNSIIIAVFAIFLIGELGWTEWVMVNSGMFSILVSSLLLLSVVWIHWSTTADLEDLDEHARVLLSVRRRRTIRYRLAWYLAVAAVVSLGVFILWRFVGRL